MNMYIGPCGIDTCARHRLVRAGGRVEVFCDVHEPGYQAFRREMKKLNGNTDGAAAAFRVAIKLGWQPIDWTCIYCSRRWPATMDIEVLQDHVLVCDEHPTRKLRDSLLKVYHGEVGFKMPDHPDILAAGEVLGKRQPGAAVRS